ncbi:MAG: hypothetical protein U5Q44_08555 [Dehalococcoidia bacterium]|nr:hypothetical protein [Dehalococcoidia bacterium]
MAGALPNRTGGFENTTNIDGLASLARNNPDEYALTRWIAENTDPGTVVIEATGRTWQAGEDGPVMTDGGVDYSDAGRIASRTGRPTPIGWYFHEIQWRGDTEENQERFSRRQDDVDALYLADDEQAILDTMRRYDAEYVVVGSVERPATRPKKLCHLRRVPRPGLRIRRSARLPFARRTDGPGLVTEVARGQATAAARTVSVEALAWGVATLAFLALRAGLHLRRVARSPAANGSTSPAPGTPRPDSPTSASSPRSSRPSLPSCSSSPNPRSPPASWHLP